MSLSTGMCRTGTAEEADPELEAALGVVVAFLDEGIARTRKMF
jgi:hypothetical protein